MEEKQFTFGQVYDCMFDGLTPTQEQFKAATIVYNMYKSIDGKLELVGVNTTRRHLMISVSNYNSFGKEISLKEILRIGRKEGKYKYRLIGNALVKYRRFSKRVSEEVLCWYDPDKNELSKDVPSSVDFETFINVRAHNLEEFSDLAYQHGYKCMTLGIRHMERFFKVYKILDQNTWCNSGYYFKNEDILRTASRWLSGKGDLSLKKITPYDVFEKRVSIPVFNRDGRFATIRLFEMGLDGELVQEVDGLRRIDFYGSRKVRISHSDFVFYQNRLRKRSKE